MNRRRRALLCALALAAIVGAPGGSGAGARQRTERAAAITPPVVETFEFRTLPSMRAMSSAVAVRSITVRPAAFFSSYRPPSISSLMPFE